MKNAKTETVNGHTLIASYTFVQRCPCGRMVALVHVVSTTTSPDEHDVRFVCECGRIYTIGFPMVSAYVNVGSPETVALT